LLPESIRATGDRRIQSAIDAKKARRRHVTAAIQVFARVATLPPADQAAYRALELRRLRLREERAPGTPEVGSEAWMAGMLDWCAEHGADQPPPLTAPAADPRPSEVPAAVPPLSSPRVPLLADRAAAALPDQALPPARLAGGAPLALGLQGASEPGQG
jgi:hypothetical protein